MSIFVRPATNHDTAEIVRVTSAAYRVEDFFVDGDRTDAQDISERLRRPQACILVAVSDEGALVGSVYVEFRNERGYFGMLAVDPMVQKQGVGRLLVEAAEAHCRAAGCAEIEIDVVDLREELPAFYARFGYAPVGTGPFPDAGKLKRPAHLVVMTKRLGA